MPPSTPLGMTQATAMALLPTVGQILTLRSKADDDHRTTIIHTSSHILSATTTTTTIYIPLACSLSGHCYGVASDRGSDFDAAQQIGRPTTSGGRQHASLLRESRGARSTDAGVLKNVLCSIVSNETQKGGSSRQTNSK